MKQVLFGVYFAVIIAILFVVGTIIWIIYGVAREKAPTEYAEELLDHKMELDFQGEDIQALFREVEELFHYEEDNWNLGRVSVREMKRNTETMLSKQVYLYYQSRDNEEEIYRRIRILNEDSKWYVVEAMQQDQAYEYVNMDEEINESMLEEIWGLVEKQAVSSVSEGDECEITITSKEVTITVFQENAEGKKIALRVELLINGAKGEYQLKEVAEYPNELD